MLAFVGALSVPNDNRDTDALLREFLLERRQEERKQAATERRINEGVTDGVNRVLQAFQTFSTDLTERLTRFEHKTTQEIQQIRERADSAHALALGANKRIEDLESERKIKSSHVQTIYELGDDSPTGTHLVISKDVLERHELEQKGKAYRVWQTVILSAAATIIAGVSVAKLVACHL